MIVKLVENIPQSNLVIRESLSKKSSISFFQLASPSFGVFSASYTFSSIAGCVFKADRIYVYYDDVKAKVLPNEVDNTWLQYFKLLIVDNKDIKPEDYQHIGRNNSATFLYQNHFNLPPSEKKQIDSLLFGTKILTLA